MKKINILYAMALVSLASCKNNDWEFPDFEFQSVYFAYQTPVRTVTLGEDIFDNSLDNQHKVKVMATTGGVYNNKKDIRIDFVVDNSLTNGLHYPNGQAVTALPDNYYQLASNQISIPSGSLTGGVEVQLTDAFFADPKSLETYYVLPLRMTKVVNADSILSGKTSLQTANRAIASDWDAAPKDFIFYALKYINPWHGNYLRRGTDQIVGKGANSSLTKSVVRHQAYVEKDEVKNISTAALKKSVLPLSFKGAGDVNINVNLNLSFDDDNNCSVSSASAGVSATGSGKFVKRGEKNSWGNADRDALYLSYTIDMAQMTVTSKDTLVMRDRSVKMETFTPVKK
ncbi:MULTISPECIES: DUF5627 domain-containing protein [Sphingobacterium]|uniref:DUF5627 domain-containing protein n=1 Tax=Sphingobacterium TaxID=28453 RepID=UPI000627C629|nr:DUF5627 domain-containing protein [Sphingobacterium sp. Ag1]KKO89748.1 adhesin [Sphingobacterium sp. Ag1]MDF2850068.1 adhesin [Sphingobacterium multivorum]